MPPNTSGCPRRASRWQALGNASLTGPCKDADTPSFLSQKSSCQSPLDKTPASPGSLPAGCGKHAGCPSTGSGPAPGEVWAGCPRLADSRLVEDWVFRRVSFPAGAAQASSNPEVETKTAGKARDRGERRTALPVFLIYLFIYLQEHTYGVLRE